MSSEKYRSYVICGHAILQQEGILQTERYVANGTITRDTKVVEATGGLCGFDTEEEAELARLSRAPKGHLLFGDAE
ncbi:hypothetical protein P0D96_24500 [Paraburkholderia sp. RL17-347-BIC-D]